MSSKWRRSSQTSTCRDDVLGNLQWQGECVQ